MQTFTCNICDHVNSVPIQKLDREVASCESCGSTVRLRSVIYLLARAIYGSPRTIGEFANDTSIRGIGLSDWSGYADRLQSIFSYTNTFIHQEPRLDIVAVPEEMNGTLDFVISSDVFEHVLPPIQRAFDNAARLLKPGGHLILTVPYSTDAETIEHYPNVLDYATVRLRHRICVVTIDERDVMALDERPIFHGGDGDTLEIRLFGEKALHQNLARAGFSEVTVLREAIPEYGIAFPQLWSLPILARKPPAP